MYNTLGEEDPELRTTAADHDDGGGFVGLTVRRRLFNDNGAVVNVNVGVPEVVYDSREVSIEYVDGVFHWLFTDMDSYFEREYARARYNSRTGASRYNYRVNRGGDFDSIWKRAMLIESREGYPAAGAA